MSVGFYPRLCLTGIVKNKKIYFPYLLTCICMVMMHYIISYLSVCPSVAALSEGQVLRTMFSFGRWVIGFFSCIFLFYTSSFLAKRRRREFGLYNILGMGKWNIARILIWETLLMYLLTLFGGLGCGILFSKLVELCLLLFLPAQVQFHFSVDTAALMQTGLLTGVIFLLIFANNLIRLQVSRPAELLRSEAAGEKPPKSNRSAALLGIICLGIAYTLALSAMNAVKALLLFFVAVLLVIAATYLLFIAGSVVICRRLQKCRSYYYKTSHFISTGFMVYRMKRNGASLASICILSTMVLVTLSTVSCLLFGLSDTLRQMYPRDITFSLRADEADDAYISAIKAVIKDTLDEYGIHSLNERCYSYFPLLTRYEDGCLYADYSNSTDSYTESDRLYQFLIIFSDEYAGLTGRQYPLADDEVLLYCEAPAGFHDTLTFDFGSYRIREVLSSFPDMAYGGYDPITVPAVLVMSGPAALEPAFLAQADWMHAATVRRSLPVLFAFDLSCDAKEQIAVCHTLWDRLHTQLSEFPSSQFLTLHSLAEEQQTRLSTFGSLFFLGVFLSIIFLAATVLIIYYKQLAEGYEDQAKFEILRHIGMTGREIRQSINHQTLLIFLLPPAASGVHLLFAFAMIRKILLVYGLSDMRLFSLVIAVCYLVFVMFYLAVYKITSKAYYHIVSRKVY